VHRARLIAIACPGSPARRRNVRQLTDVVADALLLNDDTIRGWHSQPVSDTGPGDVASQILVH